MEELKAKQMIRSAVFHAWRQINKRNVIENRLQKQLFQSSEWHQSDTIAITISTALEWDTIEIIKKAWKEGKRVAIPKCFPLTKEMCFYQYNPGDKLLPIWKDMLEPVGNARSLIKKSEIDLIVVPGIAFDKAGFRIGYGGGYYDRYLQGYQGISMSIAAAFQLYSSIPTQSHDVPVDIIITDYCKVYQPIHKKAAKGKTSYI
ncbi:5-formyltetrahydrofolate cyclo-ligase [Gracilibacillus caseinilyticus]|uniref:5-formyltetrahydrofolate cyclo-ligase n=1 Tax=Gracilibacillus caseinilyticus TaxID=2932256 RepID=A0ABY4ET58_9BACI|nr:5-formyltetrahydrofolate cyclo-ligase [Gracilibacillus caseinilyticus]UOQ47449.1 5-formyltetrahydrofolate cyclo-ligase [Gracilibacillus caseinilyticus]